MKRLVEWLVRPSLFWSTGLILLVLAMAVIAIYNPGKAGPFLADDYPNIVDNSGVLLKHFNSQELSAAWSANTSGPFKRPLASLSFAFNYYFSGQQFSPTAFKLTNIGLHIINSFLVFFLSRLLFKAVSPAFPSRKLAFLSAAIWALHPLQLTSVLYVVQRMNSMSCLFMLSGFLLFLKGRFQADKPIGIILMLSGCALGTVLGVLSKENALLLPALIFIAELTLLPTIPSAARNKVYGYYAVSTILPVLLGVAYLIINPQYLLNSYLIRDFSITERVMTEARVLFYYLGLIIYPDATQLSLAHDDFPLSTDLFQPFNTVLAIGGVVGLIAVALYNCHRKRLAFLNFAILWFFVGHVMESSVFALELVYEHRNYLPSIGIVIGFVALLYQWLAGKISNGLLNVLYACITISLAFATYTRSAVWSNANSFSYFEMRNHPASLRATSAYAKVLELKYGANEESYRYFLIASQLDTFEMSTLVDVFIELNSLLDLYHFNPDSQDVPLPKYYDDPLILNKKYMQALKKLVHQEILRRIANRTYTLRTMTTIRTAANCVLNENPMCINMAPDVLEWVDGTLNQADFADKPMMHIIKAKLNFFQGRLDKAWEGVDQAIAMSPDRMYFYAEKAHLYLVLKKFDMAEQVMREAESRGVANGADRKEFQKLRDIIVSLQANLQP
ncbi:hypothetical protein RO575_13710 [Methylomonas sp. MO1]|nr:hypothetical protein [Methylomonas sp. MO1]MDT4290617.1 hypothetical protein [Methylomonas sp. MO1]